jgi:NADH:ubiquinone oxidoreductase subunit 6 (subunit J)
MTLEERRSWTYLAVAVLVYGGYLVSVLGRAASEPLADVDYVPVMLWSIGIAIVAGIVVSVVVGMFTPRRDQKIDVRDRDIAATGERVGQSFLVIGGVAALLLAMIEAPHFYIANVLYLGFVLSAVLGSITKVIVYRRGF